MLREEGGDVLEGVLRCPRGECQREVPILDGIPILVPQIRAWMGANLLQVYGRDDLPETLESLLGDCCGPGTPFDSNRQHLSSYAWDHYGDLDPQERAAAGAAPGAVVTLLERGLELAGETPAGPRIDAGCSVGRATFELARRCDDLVLGVDLNFAMLRLASRVLRRGTVRYPRRRVGVVYDRRQFAAELPGAERVDFWACDAAALPFAAGTFSLAAGLNLIDCVPSPPATLQSLARVLAPGGRLILTSPYDWSAAATPYEAWLGGHSQRSDARGASEPVIGALLTPGAHPAAVPGLRILAEEAALPWRVRLHERSTVEYRVHLLAAEAAG